MFADIIVKVPYQRSYLCPNIFSGSKGVAQGGKDKYANESYMWQAAARSPQPAGVVHTHAVWKGRNEQDRN